MSVTVKNVIDTARGIAGVSSLSTHGNAYLIKTVAAAEESMRLAVARQFPDEVDAATVDYTFPTSAGGAKSLATIDSALANSPLIYKLEDTGYKGVYYDLVDFSLARHKREIVGIVAGNVLYMRQNYGSEAPGRDIALRIYYVPARSSAVTALGDTLQVPAFCELICERALAAYVASMLGYGAKDEARGENRAEMSIGFFDEVLAAIARRSGKDVVSIEQDPEFLGEVHAYTLD